MNVTVPYAVALEAINDKLRQRIAELENEIARLSLGLTIDFSGVPLQFGLTPAECKIVALMVSSGNGFAAKRAILAALAAGKKSVPTHRVIDVHIRNIRVKLEPFDIVIETARGRGYKIRPEGLAKIAALQSGTELAPAC